VWIPWAWWAAVVGLGTMVVSYRNMVGAAEAYGDIVEAAFDVHRAKLYEALRWPLPANAAEELRTGKELTRYLWRGSEDRSLAFADGKMT
jgi:hypothetical protein